MTEFGGQFKTTVLSITFVVLLSEHLVYPACHSWMSSQATNRTFFAYGMTFFLDASGRRLVLRPKFVIQFRLPVALTSYLMQRS